MNDFNKADRRYMYKYTGTMTELEKKRWKDWIDKARRFGSSNSEFLASQLHKEKEDGKE